MAETIQLIPKKKDSFLKKLFTGNLFEMAGIPKEQRSYNVAPIISTVGIPLIKPAPIKAKTAVKAALAAPLAAGILSSSPKAVDLLKSSAKRILNPKAKFEAGEQIGQIIEQGLPTSTGEKIKDIAKKAGLTAGAVAAGAAAVAGVKKAVEKVKEKALAPNSLPASTEAIVATSPIPADFQPITTAPAQAEEAQAAVPVATTPAIKITNKPQINIKVSAVGIKRRFINQYNVIRR